MADTATDTSVPGLRVRQDDAVLRITLARPERRNALNDDMVTAMIDRVVAAGTDESVRVILLDADGPDFCAGSDLIAKNAPADRRPRVGTIQRRVPGKAHRLVPLLAETQVPVVAVVRGWTAGLGFHLALAADFCVAAHDARFWEPFMSRGFTPDSGATWLLPRLIGLVATRKLLLLGAELTGAQAAQWGLIHAAVPEAELEATAADLIARLAAAPTVAVGLTKWLLCAGTGVDFDSQLHNEAMALELSSRSEDFREGLAAFRDKRRALFTGR